jgi:hypothetical protein
MVVDLEGHNLWSEQNLSLAMEAKKIIGTDMRTVFSWYIKK